MSDITIEKVEYSLTIQETENGLEVVEQSSPILELSTSTNQLEITTSPDNEVMVQTQAPYTIELSSIIMPPSEDTAERLQETRIANETISALQLVTAINDTHVEIAEPDNYNNSTVLGVAIGAGNSGDAIPILLFGKLEDAFFTFPVNDPLFLLPNGLISNVAPATPSENFSTMVGFSLGAGAVFLNIERPIGL